MVQTATPRQIAAPASQPHIPHAKAASKRRSAVSADLAVSVAVGATLATSVASVTGSTVKHLDGVRKAVGATERATRQVAGYRAMRTSLGAATAAMRDAERRTAELRREVVSTARPTAALRQRFAAARAETRQLTAAVGRQRRQLVGQARALRESGVNVSRLRRFPRTRGDVPAQIDLAPWRP